jgi:hypothetical protein
MMAHFLELSALILLILPTIYVCLNNETEEVREVSKFTRKQYFCLQKKTETEVEFFCSGFECQQFSRISIYVR